jgi:hypothetical protein
MLLFLSACIAAAKLIFEPYHPAGNLQAVKMFG